MIRSRLTVPLTLVALLASAAVASERPPTARGEPTRAARPPLILHAARARIKPRVRTVAQKGPVAACTLTEILATTEKKGIDPKLKKLESKLTKPPFSAWDTFSLLAESGVKAPKDKPTDSKLATGGSVTLVFKDKLVSQGGRPRLRLSVDMDSASGTRTVSTVIVFDSGDSVLFAGEPYQKGTYILALSCTAQ